MTVHELASLMFSLVPVYGDCDVALDTHAEDGALPTLSRVVANVTPVEGDGFPIVVLVAEEVR